MEPCKLDQLSWSIFWGSDRSLKMQTEEDEWFAIRANCYGVIARHTLLRQLCLQTIFFHNCCINYRHLLDCPLAILFRHRCAMCESVPNRNVACVNIKNHSWCRKVCPSNVLATMCWRACSASQLYQFIHQASVICLISWRIEPEAHVAAFPPASQMNNTSMTCRSVACPSDTPAL